VVLAYIHPGQTSGYFTQSLVNLLMYDQATDRRVVGCLNEWSSANVSTARNSLTRRFLDEYDADWLLWIDADMAFEHDALPRLLASADADERPIVGGLCFGAHFGALFPTIYQYRDRDDGRVRTIRVNDYPLETLVRCAGTGAAFVMIHRRVLAAMRDHGFNAAFPWFQETELAGQPAGEDLTFCIRAGILGFPIFVDTGSTSATTSRRSSTTTRSRRSAPPQPRRSPMSVLTLTEVKTHLNITVETYDAETWRRWSSRATSGPRSAAAVSGRAHRHRPSCRTRCRARRSRCRSGWRS
jgi:hypothetical protein